MGGDGPIGRSQLQEVAQHRVPSPSQMDPRFILTSVQQEANPGGLLGGSSVA